MVYKTTVKGHTRKKGIKIIPVRQHGRIIGYMKDSFIKDLKKEVKKQKVSKDFQKKVKALKMSKIR